MTPWHHAYAGNLEQARDYLERARRCFVDSRDLGQNLSYRFFLSLEAKDMATAQTLIRELFPEGVDAVLRDPDKPWKLFPALRFLREMGRWDHGRTLDDLGDALLSKQFEAHPWQLVLYNLGLLVENDGRKLDLLRASARVCAKRGLGSTVMVMALLPLAAMRRLGLRMPGNVRDRVERIRRLVSTSSLDKNHFAPILRAQSWKEALDATSEHETRLFPFNYR